MKGQSSRGTPNPRAADRRPGREPEARPCLHSLKLLQESCASTDRPARLARTPAGVQTARHCHRVGGGGGAAPRAPSAGRAAEDPVPCRRNSLRSGSARGRRPGGGARRRRSRGLATGTSQWERESGGALHRPPERRGGEWGHPGARASWAGKGLPRWACLLACSRSPRRGRARDGKWDLTSRTLQSSDPGGKGPRTSGKRRMSRRGSRLGQGPASPLLRPLVALPQTRDWNCRLDPVRGLKQKE